MSVNKKNFQRRHYVAVAEAINTLWSEARDGEMMVATKNEESYRDALTDTISELSKTFFYDNPNFDQTRFTEACRKRNKKE